MFAHIQGDFFSLRHIIHQNGVAALFLIVYGTNFLVKKHFWTISQVARVKILNDFVSNWKKKRLVSSVYLNHKTVSERCLPSTPNSELSSLVRVKESPCISQSSNLMNILQPLSKILHTYSGKVAFGNLPLLSTMYTHSNKLKLSTNTYRTRSGIICDVWLFAGEMVYKRLPTYIPTVRNIDYQLKHTG